MKNYRQLISALMNEEATLEPTKPLSERDYILYRLSVVTGKPELEIAREMRSRELRSRMLALAEEEHKPELQAQISPAAAVTVIAIVDDSECDDTPFMFLGCCPIYRCMP